MQGGEVEIARAMAWPASSTACRSRRRRLSLASVSKQFTVTTALLLAAEDKLGLSDPRTKYLRELKPLPVTIDQMNAQLERPAGFLELLAAGRPGPGAAGFVQPISSPLRTQRPSQLRAGQPLPLQQHQLPAARLIIERLTKQKLGAVMENASFKPLGMTDTMLAPRSNP